MLLNYSLSTRTAILTIFLAGCLNATQLVAHAESSEVHLLPLQQLLTQSAFVLEVSVSVDSITAGKGKGGLPNRDIKGQLGTRTCLYSRAGEAPKLIPFEFSNPSYGFHSSVWSSWDPDTMNHTEALALVGQQGNEIVIRQLVPLSSVNIPDLKNAIQITTSDSFDPEKWVHDATNIEQQPLAFAAVLERAFRAPQTTSVKYDLLAEAFKQNNSALQSQALVLGLISIGANKDADIALNTQMLELIAREIEKTQVTNKDLFLSYMTSLYNVGLKAIKERKQWHPLIRHLIDKSKTLTYENTDQQENWKQIQDAFQAEISD